MPCRAIQPPHEDRHVHPQVDERPASSSPGPGHRHLWSLLDGTLAHAPPGRLTFSPDGLVACHLCGRWFTHLGLHLRAHGWTAHDYRAAVGLARSRPLCSPTLSAQMARRQHTNWLANPDLRAAFAPGQGAARSGALAARASQVARDRAARGDVRPEVRNRQQRQLELGREAAQLGRAERLAAVVAAAGYCTLSEYLRATYGAGASLEHLARTTGLGREKLRDELSAAGVVIRPRGKNVLAHKQARAQNIDAEVARRLGVPDVRAWLADQRAAGRSLRDLAHATGRSIPWVRSRVAGPTATTTAPPLQTATSILAVRRRREDNRAS